jgi:hypothetical protein
METSRSSRSRKGDKALRQSAVALQEAEENLRACRRLEAYFKSRWKADPDGRKWIVGLYTQASIEKSFAELRLSEVKASKVEGGKALNVEVFNALRDAQEECFRAQKKGDAAPLLQGLPHFGLELFITDGEVNQLFWWWLDLFRVGVQGDQPALRLYKQVCDALGKGAQGAHKNRDPYEQRQEKVERDRQAKRDKRAPSYYEKAWQQYLQRTKGMTAPKDLAAAAADISEAEFSRQTFAKQQAKGWFLQKVKQDPRLHKTVARKTRGFPR